MVFGEFGLMIPQVKNGERIWYWKNFFITTCFILQIFRLKPYKNSSGRDVAQMDLGALLNGKKSGVKKRPAKAPDVLPRVGKRPAMAPPVQPRVENRPMAPDVVNLDSDHEDGTDLPRPQATNGFKS